MTKRTLILGIKLTTDEPDETLLDQKLWAKAVGVFKADVEIETVIIDGTGKGVVMSKPAKKKKAVKKAAKKAKKKP